MLSKSEEKNAKKNVELCSRSKMTGRILSYVFVDFLSFFFASQNMQLFHYLLAGKNLLIICIAEKVSSETAKDRSISCRMYDRVI